MKLIIALYIIGAVLWVLYILEKTRRYSPQAVLLKTCVSAVFLMVGLTAAFRSSSVFSYPCWMLAGLVLCLMGDVWLDLKYTYRNDETFWTFCGFISFACAHILFIIGILTRYGSTIRTILVVLALILGFAASYGNIKVEKQMKMNYGKYKLITFIYGGILLGITLMTLFLAISNGFHNKAINLLFIGMVLFMLSDLVLSQTYFGGEGKEAPVYLILNYLTYYPAVYLIATSILYA